jgi:hypothetical protein
VTVAPVAEADAYSGLVNNTQLVVTSGATASPSTPFVGVTGTLMANDQPSGSVSVNAGIVATSAGGSVTLAADGTFVYTPPASPAAAAITGDSFTYTVASSSGGGTAVSSAPATVTLSLAGRVWYVLNNGAGGMGRSHDPFSMLSAAVAASTDNDTIYVHRGTGTTTNLATAAVLKSGQRLIGEGAALVVNGHTLRAAGDFPLLGNRVTLAGSVTVDGFDMTSTGIGGIAGTSVTGVSVSIRNLTPTTGPAITIGGTGNTGTYAFGRVSSSGGANGIALTNLTSGSFTVTGDGATTDGLLARNGSGGTITGTSGHAVVLNNAHNVTLRQMTITNTAAGGSCPEACTSNAVNSAGGAAIVLSAMSMSSLGGHGWNATNVTGASRFDHNGRIAGWNTAQANGIRFHNDNTTFTSLTIDRALLTTSVTGGAGVDVNAQGTTTGTVTVTDSEFSAIDGNAVQIHNDGSGILTAIVQKSHFHDADATSGDGNNTLHLANTDSGRLHFTVGGPAAADGNTFHNLARLASPAGVIQVDNATAFTTGSRLNGSIRHNTIGNDAGFVNGRRGIDVQVEANGGSHGSHAVLIADNTISNVFKQGINVTLVSVDGGDISGNNITVTDNTLTSVGTEGDVDSGSAIEIESVADVDNTGTTVSANILVQGNTASNSNTSGTGSTLEINNRVAGGANTSVFHVTAWSNTLTNDGVTGNAEVFEVLSSLGTAGGGNPTICLDLNGANDPAHANTYTGGNGTGFKLTHNAGTFNIAGMVAGAQSAASVQDFLSPGNDNLTVTASGSFAGVSSCTLPSLPTF